MEGAAPVSKLLMAHGWSIAYEHRADLGKDLVSLVPRLRGNLPKHWFKAAAESPPRRKMHERLSVNAGVLLGSQQRQRPTVLGAQTPLHWRRPLAQETYGYEVDTFTVRQRLVWGQALRDREVDADRAPHDQPVGVRDSLDPSVEPAGGVAEGEGARAGDALETGRNLEFTRVVHMIHGSPTSKGATCVAPATPNAVSQSLKSMHYRRTFR
jgi:hypothetical protein